MRHRCMTRFTSCFLGEPPWREQRKQLAGAASLSRHSISSHTGSALLRSRARCRIAVTTRRRANRAESASLVPCRRRTPSKAALRFDAVRLMRSMILISSRRFRAELVGEQSRDDGPIVDRDASAAPSRECRCEPHRGSSHRLGLRERDLELRTVVHRTLEAGAARGCRSSLRTERRRRRESGASCRRVRLFGSRSQAGTNAKSIGTCSVAGRHREAARDAESGSWSSFPPIRCTCQDLNTAGVLRLALRFGRARCRR